MFYERLSEPLHLNAMSLFVAAFGSYRTKVIFDLIPRQQYAYGVLRAADLAANSGLKAVTIVEFGVAEGTGLMNLCRIGQKVTITTGIEFDIVGFDGGVGMPPPKDYRDHPDLYQEGDFRMIDKDRLQKVLPSNARIIFGQFKETVPAFTESLTPKRPLGFVVLDVDYYSSAVVALEVLSHPDPTKYLSLPVVYVDNIRDPRHNEWCGELLAVREFNNSQPMRKLARDTFLRSRRVFKNAIWLDQVFLLHVLDHPERQPETAKRRTNEECGNPYFRRREVPHRRL
jgi:hypothetical protein